MRIYLAGKITGMEQEAAQKFEQAEKQLSELDVVNPMKLPHKHGKSWREYLAECIQHLVTCEAIYLLDNWHQSRGARLEYLIARRLGLMIFFESNQQEVISNGKGTSNTIGNIHQSPSDI